MDDIHHSSNIFEIKVPVYINKHNVHFLFCLKILKPFLLTKNKTLHTKVMTDNSDFQKEGNSLLGRNSVHLFQLAQVDNLISRDYLLIDVEIFHLR